MTPQEKREELLNRSCQSRHLIRKLREGCCTDKRHCMFDDLSGFLDEVEKDMREGDPHPIIGELQRKMVRMGEVLGKLAIGCCMPERIPDYNECIKLLNSILYGSFELSVETPP